MNIAFMVEWSRFAEEGSVDIYEVVKAIRMRPTHQT
jgi:UDP-N-acetyl-D-mannosaminuronate dehydrogenase